jgi:hypothetical protein
MQHKPLDSYRVNKILGREQGEQNEGDGWLLVRSVQK